MLLECAGKRRRKRCRLDSGGSGAAVFPAEWRWAPIIPRSVALTTAYVLAPASGAQWRLHAGAWQARGRWGALAYTVRLQLHATAPVWSWHVDLHNAGAHAQTVDLVLLHDVALAPYGAARINEYYVSQYLDHMPLDHAAHGTVLATRQNLAGPGQRLDARPVGFIDPNA